MKEVKGIISAVIFFFALPLESLVFSISLKDLVNISEKNNRRIKALGHRVKAHDWKLDQILSKYKPKLLIESYYGYQEYKPYNRGTVSSNLKYFYVSLKQPVFYPEVFKEYQQEKVYKEIEELNLQKEKQSFRYTFLNMILRYAFLKKKLDLYSQRLEKRENSLEIYRSLVENYITTKENLFIAEKKYEKELIQFIKIEKELLFLENSILSFLKDKKLLGYIYPLSENIDTDILKQLISIENFEQKLKENLDIKLYEKNIEALKLEIKKRKYERLPKLDISLSYFYSSSTAVSTVSRDKRIAIILYAPIYQGGYFRARVKEASELKKAVEEEYKALLQELKLNFEESAKKLYMVIDSYKRNQKLLEMENKLLDLIKKAYKKHVKTILDVVNQEISLISTKIMLVENVYNIAKSYMDILFVTSQLTEENIESFRIFFQDRNL